MTTSKTKQFCETSSFFKVDNRKKRSNSARLPQFLHLTTSKSQQFCETSGKEGKLSAALAASYQCVLRFFHSTCLKYCACHEKVMPGHTKCCTCHAKSSQQTGRSDAPKCNPSREMSALTFLEMLQNPHVLFTFDKVHNPLRLPRETTSEPPKVVRIPRVLYILTSKCASRHDGVHFSTSQPPKVVWRWCVFYILTSKCASRHNGVHFFYISTSKSGPNPWCFLHFDFEMCFAPQRRALFLHLNFQKWSEPGVFCTF